MAVKLNKDQQDALKKMLDFCAVFADQMLLIMKHHGLDGAEFSMMIDPKLRLSTKFLRYGNSVEDDNGLINLAKGIYDEDYKPIGKNSAEYELLFADETVRRAIEARINREKPLPPDGLWVSANRNSDPVDNGEWDINDSLS